MAYHTGANHAQIDIYKAANQVFVPLDSGSMITVFPESSLSFLALIELLGGSPGDQLKAFRNDIRTTVDHQQVNSKVLGKVLGDAACYFSIDIVSNIASSVPLTPLLISNHSMSVTSDFKPTCIHS